MTRTTTDTTTTDPTTITNITTIGPTDPDTAPLHVEVWGTGTPVILIHGSLATGADEWSAQQPLAQEGFQLIVPDRRGYGRSPAAAGEDYLVDAADVVAMMGTGAHLVGHSYGGLGAMYAAAANPDATLSLTLLEAPAFRVVPDHPAVRRLDEAVRAIWTSDLPDAAWVEQFLVMVGSDPSEFPPEFMAVATEMAPVFRNGRPYFESRPPIDEIARARYPKLVVSGGHDDGFEAVCAALAERIGAERTVVAGAGHEIQFTGAPLNEQLLALWQRGAVAR